MAWGAIIGGLLGAGGQVAGGLLGQGTGGQGKTSNFDPNLDLATQATLFSALDPLGFGQISSVPSPFEQLVGRLNSTPMANKNRNRALAALNLIRDNPELLSDPRGNNFSAEQVRGFLQDPSTVPEGRKIADAVAQKFAGYGGSGKQFQNAVNSTGNVVPVKRVARLEAALKRLGMTTDDLSKLVEQETKFNAQMKELEDAGIGGMRTDTIINRAKAAATAAGLIGGAASFAETGQPGNELARNLLARDENQLQNLQERLGLAANFGGINPSALFSTLSDARLDQNARLIEQQLGVSNALQASLNPAFAAASSVANQNNQTALNSAQIAAQQAMAAAGLRSQGAQASSSSLANGVGSGSSALGSMFANLGLLSSRDLNANSDQFSAGFSSSPFDTSSYSNSAGSFWGTGS